MLDNKKRKEERLKINQDTISASKYNALIGAIIAYGLIVNAALVMFAGDFFQSIPPLIYLIFYFICCFAGSYITAKSDKPIVSFIGYNMVVVPIGGLLASIMYAFDIADIFAAMAITAAIVGAMIIVSSLYPSIFLKMGRTLFVCLIINIIVEIFAYFIFGYSGNILYYLGILLFSCYVGYDWSKAQIYAKTIDNAIDSALDIYLDIINIFIKVLSILSDD